MFIYDAPRYAQLFFQDVASPIHIGIIDLHNNIFAYLILISILVLTMFFMLIWRYNYTLITQPSYISIKRFKKILMLSAINHGVMLEIIWTIIPALVLIVIAIPSFSLLYATDDILDPELTIKMIGNQWFWTIEQGQESFSSYMIPDSDLQVGDYRLLEVDNPLVVPVATYIRFLVTATDVLHSFAVPSLGIKVDAVPGRLNQAACYIMRPGVFYGQCSELCGVNHAFMPIKIIAID